jgi:predicted nucleotidyltransferase
VEETPHLSPAERDCLEGYLALLVEALAEDLEAVWLFGSAARGDTWWPAMPIRSDIDLLVVTRSAVSASLQEELVNATYPLFLECGRQIGPQFRTTAELDAEPSTPFLENVRLDGVRLWPSRAGSPLRSRCCTRLRRWPG